MIHFFKGLFWILKKCIYYLLLYPEVAICDIQYGVSVLATFGEHCAGSRFVVAFLAVQNYDIER